MTTTAIILRKQKVTQRKEEEKADEKKTKTLIMMRCTHNNNFGEINGKEVVNNFFGKIKTNYPELENVIDFYVISETNVSFEWMRNRFPFV